MRQTIEKSHPIPKRKASLLGDDVLQDLPTAPKEKRASRLFVLTPFVRARLAALFMTLFAMAIIAKLFTWQIQDQVRLQEYAAKLRVWESELPAQRGLIRDSNGLVLASNIWVYNLYAAPEGLSERQSVRIAEQLKGLLPNVPPSKIKEAVTYSDRNNLYNLIASAVDNDTATKIRAAQLPSVFLEAKPRRTYPNATFLSHVLGFANNENQGAYGIEGRYNKELRGAPGTRLAEHDREGNPIVLGQIQIKPTIEGGDISLTIDSSIQYIVERELLKGMKTHSAEKAIAIVADPQTGAILAWASFPNYDPNEFYKTDPQLLRDPAVSDIYEPGSTFKILTASIGIDTGVITPESGESMPGCVLKYGRRICNFDSVGYPNQTVVKTLERSSNVGTMWIAERIGFANFYKYLKLYGIGEATDIDVSGEVEGILRTQASSDWIPLDFLTQSFGQSVAITPIQIVRAVSAVANGGKLMKPYIVSKIVRDGEVILENKPTVIRQVISAQSAKTTTDMLVSAVQNGETQLAKVAGYRVAGKTGTSTLYDSNFTIGSTIAYAPADNPRFIVYVRYDKTKDTPWGSNTAAPVVKTITDQLFTYYKIPPSDVVK